MDINISLYSIETPV